MPVTRRPVTRADIIIQNSKVLQNISNIKKTTQPCITTKQPVKRKLFDCSTPKVRRKVINVWLFYSKIVLLCIVCQSLISVICLVVSGTQMFHC